jgi:aminomethyltransferase
MDKKTPLYAYHVKAGAAMTEFAGYSMPVQYTDILKEHMAVRTEVGLFDVSHMGEVLVAGPGALPYLNQLLTNDFTGMAVGRVRYSPMCNPQGGVIDDLLIYRMGPETYLAVVNAGNHDKDVAWMRQQRFDDVTLTDISDTVAQLALQGPRAKAVLAKLTDEAGLPAKYYTFKDKVAVAGIPTLVSKTGYTGEDGYELYCDADKAGALWEAVISAGEGEGLTLCGLGARDTLRLEAAMPLYGHEMDDSVSPLETGLDFAVKMNKPDFIGKAALAAKGEPAITRVGLKVTGRGIIREHCPLFLDGKPVGHTTSGTFLPYLKGAYAMALVEKTAAQVGAPLTALVRGREIAAQVVSLPFYKKA